MGVTNLIELEDVQFEWGLIRIATFNRPQDKNPLDMKTVAELTLIAEEAAGAADVRGLIITGRGDAFSAGGDLKGYMTLYQDPVRFRQFQQDIYHICDVLESGDLVSLAMVNGTCVAGGLELALACDFILMSEDAKIGDGHLKFGQLPGAGGSQRLCRAIGFQRSKEILLTAKLYSAEEALDMLLVNAVAPAHLLREEAIKLCASAARYSPLATRRMKELILLSQGQERAEALTVEEDVVHKYATTSHDAYEGLLSFVEKRPASYSGR